MALIKCPECNKEISDQAISCPHCGFPLSKLGIEKQNKEQIDLSSCEVILKRGVKKSIRVTMVILLVLAILIAVGDIIYFLTNFYPTVLVGLIIVYMCLAYIIAMYTISAVKMSHNSNLRHECLYYDKNTNKFYAELWNFDVIALEASEEILLKQNYWAFNENLIMYRGHKYNIGYSSTDLDTARIRLLVLKGEKKNEK